MLSTIYCLTVLVSESCSFIVEKIYLYLLNKNLKYNIFGVLRNQNKIYLEVYLHIEYNRR